MRNCETATHCCGLVSELVTNGFAALAAHLTQRTHDHAELTVATHRQHLDVFRGLYLSLGELAHKKARRIEEIDRSIQTNHIQQELAADTLNPNAKKFSDAKKELLRARDDVERDLETLRARGQKALARFAPSEAALRAAGVEFVHPTVEQEDEEFETKSKMVEYKALAMGHLDRLSLRSDMESTRRTAEGAPRTPLLGGSLPLLRGGFSPADRSVFAFTQSYGP